MPILETLTKVKIIRSLHQILKKFYKRKNQKIFEKYQWLILSKLATQKNSQTKSTYPYNIYLILKYNLSGSLKNLSLG